MNTTRWIIAALVTGLLSVGASAQVLSPPGAEDMLRKYRAVLPPPVDVSRQQDPAYQAELRATYRTMSEKRNAIAVELVRQFPDHPGAVPTLIESWQQLSSYGDPQAVLSQSGALLEANPKSPYVKDVLYVRAMVTVRSMPEPAEMMRIVDAFIAAAPGDPRGGELLYAASQFQSDPEQRQAIIQRLIQTFPNTPYAQRAEGAAKQLQAVGKPFELAFTDAISGRRIDLQKDWKGKIVVVDFWATWCGPCIAEMPTLKKLYAEFHDKGVEFVGISLDQPEAAGGLTALKDYVAKNEIPWPQYYQGNAWESEFSSGWGITGIPSLFLIDADGKLFSTEARSQLEKLIPELISKRDNAVK